MGQNDNRKQPNDFLILAELSLLNVNLFLREPLVGLQSRFNDWPVSSMQPRLRSGERAKPGTRLPQA